MHVQLIAAIIIATSVMNNILLVQRTLDKLVGTYAEPLARSNNSFHCLLSVLWPECEAVSVISSYKDTLAADNNSSSIWSALSACRDQSIFLQY